MSHAVPFIQRSFESENAVVNPDNVKASVRLYRGAGTGGAEGAAAPPVFSVGNCKLLWIKKIYRL